MILQCSHIQKTFLTDTVLSDISFHINEQEKAAIVGINGSGKSTLLKIIVGQLPAEEGEVILAKGTTIGYLAQNQEYHSERTILEEMQDAKPEIVQLEKKMAALSAQMEHTVRDQEGEFPLLTVSVACGLFDHLIDGDHDIPQDQLSRIGLDQPVDDL